MGKKRSDLQPWREAQQCLCLCIPTCRPLALPDPCPPARPLPQPLPVHQPKGQGGGARVSFAPTASVVPYCSPPEAEVKGSRPFPLKPRDIHLTVPYFSNIQLLDLCAL